MLVVAVYPGVNELFLVSVTTTQLCHYSIKVAIGDTGTNMHGSVPGKLYL